MRVIRSTCYPNAAVTMVILEADLLEPFDDAFERSRRPIPGALVVVDVFDAVPEIGVSAASIAAVARMRKERRREADMALCYHWYGTMLPRVAARGVLSATLPAPLSVEELAEVLRQIAKHPDYKEQRIFLFSREGDAVKLDAGAVEVT